MKKESEDDGFLGSGMDPDELVGWFVSMECGRDIDCLQPVMHGLVDKIDTRNGEFASIQLRSVYCNLNKQISTSILVRSKTEGITVNEDMVVIVSTYNGVITKISMFSPVLVVSDELSFVE